LEKILFFRFKLTHFWTLILKKIRNFIHIKDFFMKIAVDFDGTIVEHAYPEIGRPIPFAIDTLKLLQEKHQLILWTVRTGKELNDAIEYCRENGVEFYAVNKNFPEEEFDQETDSRKINADIFIDDRNVGGLPDWGKIYQQIEQPLQDDSIFPKKKSFFHRIFGK
jgi:hypothetical protein